MLQNFATKVYCNKAIITRLCKLHYNKTSITSLCQKHIAIRLLLQDFPDIGQLK